MEELVEVIESFNGYVKRVPAGALQIAELLRDDNVQGALQHIRDFSEGVLWLVEASELIQKNNVQIELAIEQIQDFLIEINEGLERQDFVIVADMFEYEIAPFFEKVKEVEGLIQ